MSERDGTAIGIHFRRVEPGKFYHCERLRGKRFVQFNHVDLFEFQASKSQRFRNCENWADTHFFRRAASSREGTKLREGLRADGPGAFGGHHHGCSSAIAHLRTIARSDCAFRVKRRFQFREGFERSIGARTFVGVENSCHSFWMTAVRSILRSESYFDRNGFLFKLSSRNRGERFLMA